MKEIELAVASIGGADSAAAQGTEAPASAEPAALEPQAAAAMEESGDTTAFNGEHREESAAEDSPAEALPQEDAAISLTAIQYVPTPVNPVSSVNTGGDPRTRLLSSRDDLDAYLDDMQAMFLMDDFRDACSRYDETWFASHDLLVLRIGAATEEHRFEVTGLKRLNDSQFPAWELSLNRGPVADKAFDGISMWHILMEVDKSILAEEDTIILDLEATP